MKKNIRSTITAFLLVILYLNSNGQGFTCVYEMSGQNNTCHGSNDAQIITTIPSNPYPSLAHHVYFNGTFVSNVALAGFAGQTFYSPVYFDSYGVGTWEYFAYYLDDQGQEVSCNFHSITVTDPPCSYTASLALSNISAPGCNNGQIKITFAGTFAAYPHVELYNADGLLLQNINLAAGTTSYIFTGLSPNPYTVKTFDATCCEQDFSVKVKCPKPVAGLTTTNITATTAQVNWTTLTCAAYYKVQYRPQGSTTWISKTTTGNFGNKVLTGLTPSTLYTWKVAAKCGNSHPSVFSDFSVTKNFTTASLKEGDENTAASEEEENETVFLYPNPVADLLTINFETALSNPQVEIINTLGQLVLMKKITTRGDLIYGSQLDVSALQAGQYLLVIRTSDALYQKAFVKN